MQEGEYINFQENLSLILKDGVENDGVSLTLPLGRRLVIKFVSAYATVPSDQTLDLWVVTTIGGNAAYRNHQLLVHRGHPEESTRVASQPLLAFANPGSLVTGAARRYPSTKGEAIISFTIVGYLQVVPVED